MNAQQEAVALFRFLEGRGFKPSVRSVGRILRDELGLKFTEADLRGWLSKFVASATQTDAVPTQTVATPTQQTNVNDASATHPDAIPTQADATPTRLRAHNKVSLVSSFNTNTQDASACEDQSVIEFVRWFVAAGVETLAVPKHLDFELEVMREMQRSAQDAKAILDAYGRKECELRARRFFGTLTAGKGRGYPWIKTLADRWAWAEIAGVEPVRNFPERNFRSDIAAQSEPAKGGVSDAGRRLLEYAARREAGAAQA